MLNLANNQSQLFHDATGKPYAIYNDNGEYKRITLEQARNAKCRFLEVRNHLSTMQDVHAHAWRACFSKAFLFYANKTVEQAINALLDEEKAYLNT